jgi:hypothetical protein
MPRRPMAGHQPLKLSILVRIQARHHNTFTPLLHNAAIVGSMKSHRHLKLVETIVELLDNKFAIGKFRFGLDPIIGLIPGIGDIIPIGISGYLIFIGIQENISRKVLAQMIGYTLLDFILGSIPLIGDAADFFYKSHIKNLHLLKQELGLQGESDNTSREVLE